MNWKREGKDVPYTVSSGFLNGWGVEAELG